MFEFEKPFGDTASIVNIILSLIFLIIFIRMAWNIGKIRSYLVKTNADSLLEDADKAEFKGNKEEAIDAFMEYIYLTKRDISLDAETKNIRIKRAALNVKRLGGKVPKSIERYT